MRVVLYKIFYITILCFTVLTLAAQKDNDRIIQAADYFMQGSSYYKGEGVKQDYARAVKFFQQAAEAGHAEAQYFTAWHYEHGKGVKRNLKMAKLWYKKSAEQGDKDAKKALKQLKYYLF